MLIIDTLDNLKVAVKSTKKLCHVCSLLLSSLFMLWWIFRFAAMSIWFSNVFWVTQVMLDTELQVINKSDKSAWPSNFDPMCFDSSFASNGWFLEHLLIYLCLLQIAVDRHWFCNKRSRISEREVLRLNLVPVFLCMFCCNIPVCYRWLFFLNLMDHYVHHIAG